MSGTTARLVKKLSRLVKKKRSRDESDDKVSAEIEMLRHRASRLEEMLNVAIMVNNSLDENGEVIRQNQRPLGDVNSERLPLLKKEQEEERVKLDEHEEMMMKRNARRPLIYLSTETMDYIPLLKKAVDEFPLNRVKFTPFQEIRVIKTRGNGNQPNEIFASSLQVTRFHVYLNLNSDELSKAVIEIFWHHLKHRSAGSSSSAIVEKQQHIIDENTSNWRYVSKLDGEVSITKVSTNGRSAKLIIQRRVTVDNAHNMHKKPVISWNTNTGSETDAPLTDVNGSEIREMLNETGCLSIEDGFYGDQPCVVMKMIAMIHPPLSNTLQAGNDATLVENYVSLNNMFSVCMDHKILKHIGHGVECSKLAVPLIT